MNAPSHHPKTLHVDSADNKIGIMKTTADIPDDVMRESIKYTKAKTKRDAIVGAMREFNRRQRLEALLGKLGKSDTFMTLEELMDMRMERGKYRDSR